MFDLPDLPAGSYFVTGYADSFGPFTLGDGIMAVYAFSCAAPSASEPAND